MPKKSLLLFLLTILFLSCEEKSLDTEGSSFNEKVILKSGYDRDSKQIRLKWGDNVPSGPNISWDGTLNWDGDIDGDGSFDFDGDIGNDGTLDWGDIDGDGSFDFDGNINGDGSRDFDGDLNHDGTIDWGDIDDDGSFDWDGTLNFDGDLNGDGSKDFDGDLNDDGTQDWGDSSNIDSDGTLDGDINDDGTQDWGDIDGDGSFDWDGTLNWDGDLNGDGSKDFDGDLNDDGTQDWGDGSNIDGDLNDDGTQDWGDIDGDGSFDWDGTLNFDGDLNGDGSKDWDRDLNDDGTQDWGNGVNVDGDVNNDGTRDWGNVINDVPELPKWVIGDKRTIKVDIHDVDETTGKGYIRLDYNDNLTSGLDPARAVYMNTLFIKEPGNASRSTKDISVLIVGEYSYDGYYVRRYHSGMYSDNSNLFQNREIQFGVPGEDESFGSPFFIDEIYSDIDPDYTTVTLSNLATRVSIAIKYAFTSPNTGNEETITYVWKGPFTPESGLHHELELVGYSVNGKDVGDANPYSSYVPI